MGSSSTVSLGSSLLTPAALGLSLGKAGAWNHVLKLDEDEKVSLSRAEPPALFAGYKTGPSGLSAVSEPGLYKLIQRSNKPEAKAFDRWVRHEVLPQIMDTGGYVTADANVEKVLEAAPRHLSALHGLQERPEVVGSHYHALGTAPFVPLQEDRYALSHELRLAVLQGDRQLAVRHTHGSRLKSS